MGITEVRRVMQLVTSFAHISVCPTHVCRSSPSQKCFVADELKPSSPSTDFLCIASIKMWLCCISEYILMFMALVMLCLKPDSTETFKKARFFSFLLALGSIRGRHWAVAPAASAQPAASIARHQEPAAAVGRPHPEHRAHLEAAQRQCSAQSPLHLWPQVWKGFRVGKCVSSYSCGHKFTSTYHEHDRHGNRLSWFLWTALFPRLLYSLHL